MIIIKNGKKFSFSLLIMVILVFLLNGCARWPEGSNGGNSTGQKQLIVKVEINDEGTLNTVEGNYYIVFDTNKDAPFAPDADIENWKEGYYYVQLGDIGFIFGEVLEVGTSEQYFTGAGTISEKYYQVTVSLADLGDPETIYMNVITTDEDNETYDSLDSDYYIDTNLIFQKTETDFLEESNGGPDFDLTQVTTTIITP